MIDWILHLDTSMGEFIKTHGVWIYALLSGIIFGETGLIILPFLPGDTLLFAAGSFAANGQIDLIVLLLVVIPSAILGNTLNAYIARWVYNHYGESIFSGRLRWLDSDALNKTQAFYKKHGGKALILARFLPIIRTFAPFVAGIARMPWLEFQIYNVIGAVLWGAGLLWLGVLFGNVPWIKQYLNIIILVGVSAAMIPAIIGLLWNTFKNKK